jgi:arylsulfatase A-like enzyme
LYAGGIRVPFIARWPGVIPAQRVDRDSVLTAVDLLPTFMDLAEAELPADYAPDGVSILSALRGGDFERAKPIFWEWAPAQEHPIVWPHQGIREGKWKLLFNEKIGKAELYDIEADWAEQTDLASDTPEVVERLARKLDHWKATLPKDPAAHCFSSERD